MNTFIDYVFYKLARFYYKYDGNTGYHAMVALSFTESILLLDFFLALQPFFTNDRQYHDGKYWGIIIASISIIPVSLLNYRRYLWDKTKFVRLNDKWNDETSIKRLLKGILVIFFLLAPWIIFGFMSYWKHARVATG